MLSKKTKEAIAALNYELVASYLDKHGWRKNDGPSFDSFSLWYKEIWTDEETDKLNSVKQVDEVELMLPHHKHYRDYGTRMMEVFYNLSIVYDKCECELLSEISNVVAN